MIRKHPQHHDEVIVSNHWLNRIYRLEWLAVALLSSASLWLLVQAAIA